MTHPISEPAPLAAAAEDFERSLTTRRMSQHTIRAYRGDLAAFLGFLGEATSSNDLTEAELRRFAASQAQAGFAVSTVRRRASAARQFCRWLHEEGRVAERFDGSIGLRFPPRRALPRALSEEATRQLLRHLLSAVEDNQSRRDTTMDQAALIGVALMLSTGVRVGELVSATTADIDLDTATLRIRGKGAKDRVVYIPDPWLLDLIRGWVSRRGPEHGPLLQNRRGQQLSTAVVRAQLRKAAHRAGLTERITPHMLRHTAATCLVASGVDIRIIQRLLGHASLTTTEIYAHVSDATLKTALVNANVLATRMG